MVFVRYLFMWQFWFKSLTQDLLPIVILGETISIINKQRGYDVAFVLPYPDPRLFWALFIFAFLMVFMSIVIEITETLIISGEVFSWRYVGKNSLVFLVYGFTLLGIVAFVDPTHFFNLSLFLIAFALGFFIAGMQSNWNKDFILKWGLGYSLGAAIGLSLSASLSLQPLFVKVIFYLIILFVFSLSIFHFGYGDYFSGKRQKYERF
jgi:hypothetical protein